MVMNNKELLLSKRWIVKNKDRETYYKIKDDIKNLKKIFQDTLGYSLISYQNFIKLDKVPSYAEPWMGICEFQSLEEYQILCYILIFLEDKDDQEQFILSHLTEFIQIQLNVNEQYWLIYNNRRKMVNVIKYCIKEQLFIQDDGNAEQFINHEETEVLFENTGLSRYFMRNFVSDIHEYKQPQDFMKDDWVGMNQDRGIVRKQRIYRRLMLSSGIYKNEDNDDFAFIRHYRKRMQKDFEKIAPCELQVYKSSAYLIFDEEVRIGKLFPKNNSLDELVVLVMTNLRKRAKNSDIKRDKNENIQLSIQRVKTTIERIIKDNEKFLPATYRSKNRTILINDIYKYILQLGFAKEDEDNVIFYPVIAKITGYYEEE
jgi:uncharacterized protein (TIGR02678 family)